jgi:hypothetical protein
MKDQACPHLGLPGEGKNSETQKETNLGGGKGERGGDEGKIYKRGGGARWQYTCVGIHEHCIVTEILVFGRETSFSTQI